MIPVYSHRESPTNGIISISAKDQHAGATMFQAGQYGAVLEWYFKDCATFRERRAAASPLPRDTKSS